MLDEAAEHSPASRDLRRAPNVATAPHDTNRQVNKYAKRTERRGSVRFVWISLFVSSVIKFEYFFKGVWLYNFPRVCMQIRK